MAPNVQKRRLPRLSRGTVFRGAMLAVAAVLLLVPAASYGGKLNNVYVNGYGASNRATGSYSWATQEIGKAIGAGSLIQNTTVYAPYATNSSTGYGSGAQQKVGVAQ